MVVKLLLVTQDFPPHVGGIQTWSAELASRFARSLEAFAVVAPRVPGSADIDAALPYPVHRVTASTDLLPALVTPTLVRLGNRQGFDALLHAQWPTVLGALAARKLGGPKRIFLAAHGRELLLEPLARVGPAQRVYDGARRRVIKKVDHLFPVSQYTAELLRNLGAEDQRMTVVANGTDPERFRPLDVSARREELDLGPRPVLLTVGRLTPRKGIDTVLAALPQVVERVPDVIYLVVGEGEDRTRLEQLAREMSVTDHVRFLGKVTYDELPTMYNLGDVFVTPSRSAPPSVEGFGIVFLEANACGKPVIGARTGGIPDAVIDGETGLLVDPDAPSQLADAILRLLTDTDLAKRLGAEGRRRVVEEGTWDVTHGRLQAAMEAG